MRILFRCDDAGSMLSATRGIVSAVTEGVGRCVSVMVPGPNFAGSVPLLRELQARPEVELGLHIVLNSEWEDHAEGRALRWGPVLSGRVGSLVYGDGTFKRFPKEFHEQGASTDEMVLEVEAQLDKLLAAGLRPTYADEHMGVGWVLDAREKLRRLIVSRGLKFAGDAKLAGLPKVEGLTGEPWEVLAGQILAAPEGDYLYVTHPCLETTEALGMCMKDIPPGRVAREREMDRALYCHPLVRDAIARRGAELVRYRDVM
jgi:chitin disaccharide deacetylase